MNIIEAIEQHFHSYLHEQCTIDTELINKATFTLNTDESKAQFGDINSNIAMITAQVTKKRPLELATLISEQFTHPYVEKIVPVAPGFINFYLTLEATQQLATELHIQGASFFTLFKNSTKRINIEFVSANPTGPLHFGHGRGAIIGDVIANVMRFIGQQAIKEFYINNAGAQMHKLGNSLKIRYLQLLHHVIELPEDAYHGEYLIELANQMVTKDGNAFIDMDITFFAQYAEEKMLALIKTTLESYGVTFDVWFAEKTLHQKEVKQAIQQLEQYGHLYQQDGATWFRSTQFGDDKDRVLIKADGEYTYAAADIAYMQNKTDRNFNHLVMILGHDHHSYLTRLHCIQKALHLDDTYLDIILYQLVKMKQSGDVVRMSKRAGNIITLQDVIETVGRDVARFFFLHRKADAQLEFNVDLALKQTDENPVYYVQYAYVRTKSILEKATESEQFNAISAEDTAHITHAETMLIKKMASLKSLLSTIYHTNQIHLLTYYVLELAQIFHNYYSKNRIIDPSDIQRSRGRLFVITLLHENFKTTLSLLGISQPDRM